MSEMTRNHLRPALAGFLAVLLGAAAMVTAAFAADPRADVAGVYQSGWHWVCPGFEQRGCREIRDALIIRKLAGDRYEVKVEELHNRGRGCGFKGVGSFAAGRLVATSSGMEECPATVDLADDGLRLGFAENCGRMFCGAGHDLDGSIYYRDPAPGGAAAPASRSGVSVDADRFFRDCDECPEMAVIPAGSLELGALSLHRDDAPVRTVTIARKFALGRTEVTQRQWRALMGDTDAGRSEFGREPRRAGYFTNCGDGCPVVNVSWDAAQEYARRLSKRSGAAYRLPREDEWEYACRAGSRDRYCGGSNAFDVAWFSSNGDKQIHEVAGKAANAWGLFDMSGNVREWVEDCRVENPVERDDSATKQTSDRCSFRIHKGGSWRSAVGDIRSAGRSYQNPAWVNDDVGLRVVRDLQ